MDNCLAFSWLNNNPKYRSYCFLALLTIDKCNLVLLRKIKLRTLAEGAFGNDGGYGGGDDVGECPAPGNLSPEECAGAVSNCWSPGQRDTGQLHHRCV